MEVYNRRLKLPSNNFVVTLEKAIMRKCFENYKSRREVCYNKVKGLIQRFYPRLRIYFFHIFFSLVGNLFRVVGLKGSKGGNRPKFFPDNFSKILKSSHSSDRLWIAALNWSTRNNCNALQNGNGGVVSNGKVSFQMVCDRKNFFVSEYLIENAQYALHERACT